jgi:hypothetical protein
VTRRREGRPPDRAARSHHRGTAGQSAQDEVSGSAEEVKLRVQAAGVLAAYGLEGRLDPELALEGVAGNLAWAEVWMGGTPEVWRCTA